MTRFKTGALALILSGVLLGCTATGVGPDGVPAGYERFYSPAAHNVQAGLASRGDPVRRGERSERYELRDTDCGGTDCGNPRQRAEIRLTERANPARIGQDTWYGWSFFNLNVPGYSREESLRLVFGQWTMGGGAAPILRLIQLGRGEGHWDACDRRYCSGPSVAAGDIALQLEDMHQANDWGKRENDGYVCRLFDMASNRGRWVDLVMRTNFSAGPDGYVQVWVNDVLKCDYRGPLVSAESLALGDTPEHRRGVFSSYTERWDTRRGGQVKPRKIVYYDEFAIGQSRREVDVRLRETLGLPALD
ncbi:heparin lyase I family protein [Cognatishimia sp. F0-27]|uniref:heparin lyase I family protein n=1 Tax=Cognatishimia sp. F0-27 TaxID=2816855 RepID=UPI001D0CDCB1|nr:heparin lyase I family protein [Cognatishimia sp. F0-27]MCC1494897.1 heparin lyase I family protein [Cognatishimia sp. F0-27]